MDGEGGGAPLRLRDQRGLSVLLQWYPACPGKRRFELKLAPATSVSSNPVTKPLWGTGQQKLWGGQLPAQPGLPHPTPREELACKSWLLGLSEFDSDMSILKSTWGPMSQPSFLPLPPPPSQDWAVGQRDGDGKGGT